MKKTIIFALIAVFAAAACGSKEPDPAAIDPKGPAFQLGKDLTALLPVLDPEKNAVLAQGRGFKITAVDLLAFLQGSGGNQTAQLKSLDAARLRDVVSRYLTQLGERRLLRDAAAEAKIAVADDEVAKTLAQQYVQAGGESQYLENLKTNGIEPEFVKGMIRDSLVMQQLLDKVVFASIQVSPDDLQKAYANDKMATVRHILLMTQGKPEADKPEIRRKMEGLLERAKKGEDFAALAKEFTEDPGSKENGGLYEDFGRGRMVKPFEDAAFTVPVGQVSDIVETEYGYHILKIEGRKKETRPFDEVKAELENDLKQQKQGAAYQTYIADLKAKSGFALASLDAPSGK